MLPIPAYRVAIFIAVLTGVHPIFKKCFAFFGGARGMVAKQPFHYSKQLPPTNSLTIELIGMFSVGIPKK